MSNANSQDSPQTVESRFNSTLVKKVNDPASRLYQKLDANDIGLITTLVENSIVDYIVEDRVKRLKAAKNSK